MSLTLILAVIQSAMVPESRIRNTSKILRATFKHGCRYNGSQSLCYNVP